MMRQSLFAMLALMPGLAYAQTVTTTVPPGNQNLELQHDIQQQQQSFEKKQQQDRIRANIDQVQTENKQTEQLQNDPSRNHSDIYRGDGYVR